MWNLLIKSTLEITLPEEQLNAFLVENGYTGLKPAYNEDGSIKYDIEYKKKDGEAGIWEDEDSFVHDLDGNRIEVSRTQVFEPMSKEEYTSYIVKNIAIMPVIRRTTESLESKFGTLNYNKKQMSTSMEEKMKSSTEITQIS